jgi:hypothetical protein
MFATEDIREITRLFPPNELLASGPSTDLPLLLTSLSGDYLLTKDSILREFEELSRSATQRIPVSSVSQSLDVDENIIPRVIRHSPDLALVSADERHIITKNERDALWKKIRETASGRIVPLDTFAQDQSITAESASTLVLSSYSSSEQPNDLIIETDKLRSRFVTSPLYGESLRFKLRGLLEEARNKVEPLTVISNDLPGSPPSWYVTRIINAHLNDTRKQSEWKLRTETAKVECTPLDYISQRRDEELGRLTEGSIPCIEIDLFTRQYRSLYPTEKHVWMFLYSLEDSKHLSVMRQTAVSNQWIDKFVEQSLQSMHQIGFVDVTTDIENAFPAPCQKEVLSKVMELVTLHEGNNNSKLHPVGKYILSDDHYERLRIAAHSQAREQAEMQWDALKDIPEKELRFQASTEDSRQTENNRDESFRDIYQETCKMFSKEAEKEYWDKISTLELKNEEDFSNFWTDRVDSRAVIYTEGLKVVEDAKLQSQLSELLCSYLLKDLIPDSLARARSQGLTRSRKTRKNIKKLESILSQAPIDLPTLVSATQKFGKKQGIPELGETAISEFVDSQVHDMIRKMHKQANGPLLFLTLIIVLLAKQQQKLVYATGKFAPKLMKQLKPSVKLEDYERLEKWKDLAKAGTLTSEDKEQMRAMAGGE